METTPRDAGFPDFLTAPRLLDRLPVPALIAAFSDPARGAGSAPAADSSYEGWAVLWCNEVFEQHSGQSRATLQLLGLEALRGVGGGSGLMRLTDPGVHAVDSDPLIYMRPTGEYQWLTAAFRRLERAEPWDHVWLITAQVLDPSHDVSDGGMLAAYRSEIVRRANLDLALVARVSELIALVAPEKVLASIAELLQRNVVEKAAFMAFRYDRGLEVVDGYVSDRVNIRALAARDDTDPIMQIWLDAEAGTRHLTLPPGLPAHSPAGRVHAALAPDPDAEITVLVSVPVAAGGSHQLLVALPFPAQPDAASPDPAAEDVRTVLHLVVRRVAAAMENYELHHRELVLAEALQRSMLPAEVQVEDLDVWTFYQPYSSIATVGGDWYDIAPRADGSVCVVIGDAVGHDVESVVAMNQIRTVIQSVSPRQLGPARLTRHVDRAMSGLRVSRTASMIAGRFVTDGDGGAWEFRFTRAGHLPGVVLGEDGARVLPGRSSGLLGLPTTTREEDVAVLRPGDAVVLFTDGLVERRGADTARAIDALRARLEESGAPDAAGLGEELMALAADAEDDVTLVVVKVPGAPDGEGGRRARRWQLSAEASSVAYARSVSATALQQWGIAQPEPVLLVVSELVSNAIMHGWGGVRLRLEEVDGAVRVEVEDANPTPPRPRTCAPGEGVGGFGMHVVERLAEWGWRPLDRGKVVWALVPHR